MLFMDRANLLHVDIFFKFMFKFIILKGKF